MKALLRTYEKLPLRKKVKIVVLFPILIIATAVDKIVDMFANMLEWLWGTVYYWWKEIVSVVVIVTCIVLPIYLATYIEETVPKFDGKYKYQSEAYVYTNCHEMANNFIVAEDNKVRGFVRADDKNIDRILAVIMEYELDDSEQLKTWLLELKNGNYSNAVAFHNYCWLELDGDVGWAIKLKDKFK